MNFTPLHFVHSNAELANYNRSTGRFSSANELRKSVSIAVIDDEKFAPGDNLAALGYVIDQLGDIRRVQAVEKYRIVLCDLMGVGMHFDTQKQGASLIEEIRVNYPATIVVAYTGSSLGSAPAKAAKYVADLVIKKDIDTSEWKETLDDLSRQSVDPYYVWSRIRTRLIMNDVDTKAVLIMEDAYVKGVLSKDASASALKKAVAGLNLGPDVRAIVQNLAASALFSVIAG